VIESFSPGVLERWGLGYEQLKELNRSVIMLSTSLMGQNGPYRSFAGYGNMGAAMSSFQSLVGWPDRPPLGPYGPYSDYVAPRFGLVALLAALDRRERTGAGCWIDVSQTEAAIQFLAPQVADHAATGRIAQASGNRDPALAPHGVYPCRDDGSDVGGSWVAIAVRDDDEWSALARLIGAPADARFAKAAGRLDAAGELDELVAAWTATRDAGVVETLLQEHGIPAHVAVSSVNALVDPQLVARGHFVELEHPLFGKTVVQGSRYRLSETPAAVDRPAPTLGRDNEHVLRNLLGYDDARIAELAEIGALT